MVQTVKYRAGDTILNQGDAGDTAYVIVSGQVEVSVGSGATIKTLGTLGAGEVFGEMSLIEPGPRSATVKAVSDVVCEATSFDELMSGGQGESGRRSALMRTLVRRLRQTNERIASIDPGSGHRIQQWLQVIMAGLDEQEALSAVEIETLQRELKILLQIDRFDIAKDEVDKAELVLDYMLRPNIEECLNLWFGKYELTDQEIWTRFGADVALASRGHYDHWALNLDHPRLLVALVIMLDQFRRNIYRETPEMYACDPRCLALVKRGLRVGIGERLRPIERIFLCLALTHSETLEDQHQCMEEWRRIAAELAPDDPLNAFQQIFQRHVAVIMRFGRFPHRNAVLNRPSTAAEEAFLDNRSYRFDLPLVRQPDGKLVFAGSVSKRPTEVAGAAERSAVPQAEFQYAGPDAVFNRAQEQLKHQGFVRIGDMVPDFTVMTTAGEIRFHDFIGQSWCVLFSHPSDFTPVCTTELGQAAKLSDEWKKRDTKVIGLSVDSSEDHERWIMDINLTQQTEVDFPIIADKDREISMLFGMLDPTSFRHGAGAGETMTVRSVYIISPQKRVELILTYPASIGRNFDEILRVIDALQLSSKYRVATPANWQTGDDTVVLPFISDEEAEKIFADRGGVRKVRSYLRYVRDPSMRIT